MLNSILQQYWPQLLSGTLTTIELMLLSLAFGLGMAIFMTLCLALKKPYLTIPINIFIFLIRGTPMLVQIFIIYYGSGQFDFIRASFLWLILKQPFACAVIALAINTSAYTTVLFTGAINSVPPGEIEACKAIAMSKLQMLWYIILPKAIRIALPAYSNEAIMILKGTSLASTITILDLMGVTRQIIAQTYATIECFIFAGIIYLILNTIIMSLFKLAEKTYYTTTQSVTV